MTPVPSMESVVMRALRETDEPLTSKQLLEMVPAAVLAESRNPRTKLQNLLARPQVGHSARGEYVYLPQRLNGSTFRLPLLDAGVSDGQLLFTAEAAFAHWFPHIEWGWVRGNPTATWRLPDGTQTRITMTRMLRARGTHFGGAPLVTAGPEMAAWLHAQGAAEGDSLLIRVADAEKSVSDVTLERRDKRDEGEIAARSHALAEMVEHILRQELRGKPLFAHDLTGWLAARKFYQEAVPPDPIEVALMADQRFTVSDEGKVALATRWEWTRCLEPEFVLGLPAAAVHAYLEAQGDRPTRRWREEGIILLEELQPWLTAVGYTVPSPREEAAAEVEREVSERKQQVYRLRAAYVHRPTVQRVVEARGDNTLAELDDALRNAFRHEPDHMSGFCVRVGGSERPVWLATFNPFGETEEGTDHELAELNLEPGAECTYVYDFGDWIEHTVTVEAVLPSAVRVEYPRRVLRPGPAPKRQARR